MTPLAKGSTKSRRRPGAVADDQLSFDDDGRARQQLTAQASQQRPRAGRAEFITRLANGRQSRLAELGELDIVEADDGNILRRLYAGAGCRLEEPDGHFVAATDDSRWPRTLGEEKPRGLDAASE